VAVATCFAILCPSNIRISDTQLFKVLTVNCVCVDNSVFMLILINVMMMMIAAAAAAAVMDTSHSSISKCSYC